jgi:hypothetical protein
MSVLVGRFFIAPQCNGMEFAPASTSNKYKCELTGRLASLDIVAAVTDGDYVNVRSWNWIKQSGDQAGPILVVDAASIEFKSKAGKVSDPLAFVPEASVKRHAGQIRTISAFLRMKDTQDPFNESFCVHLEDGNVFVFRGQRFFALRFLLEPHGFVELINFRKIKLKSFNDKIVYISVDESRVSKFESLDSAALKALIGLNSLESGIEVRGRVISVDSPNIWISVVGRTRAKIIPIVLGRWGLCDKRRVDCGSVIVVRNFHYAHDVIGFCPSATTLIVENLSSLSSNVFPIHSLCSASNPERCFVHNIDFGSACESGNGRIHKFGINSLCSCDCFVSCSKVGDQFVNELSQLSQIKFDSQDSQIQNENRDVLRKLRETFKKAIQEAEVCLSLLRVDEIWSQLSPPFFNIRIKEPIRLTAKGPPSTEIVTQLRGLTKPLFLSLFPPTRPLNAFNVYVSSGKDGRLVSVLIPRTVSIDQNLSYSISRLLVVSTTSSELNGVILTNDDIFSVNVTMQSTQSPTVSMSPSRTKLARRLLLRQKIQEE